MIAVIGHYRTADLNSDRELIQTGTQSRDVSANAWRVGMQTHVPTTLYRSSHKVLKIR